MSNFYSSQLHTPAALCNQLNNFPSRFVVAGSIARCLHIGKFTELQRNDGTARDIDVIDLLGEHMEHTLDMPGVFRTDASLTKIFRPYKNRWGLFLPNESKPMVAIDAGLALAQQIELPGFSQKGVNVLPAAMLTELIHLLGPFYKNGAERKSFAAYCNEHVKPLPLSIRRDIEKFRAAIWRVKMGGAMDAPLIKVRVETLYRRYRAAYRCYCPLRAQEVIESNIGSIVRKIRGTPG